MCGNLLNRRKIDFLNAIKTEETAKIYKGFIKKDEIFIPGKFKEKTPQDKEEQKKIKAKLKFVKLKAQTEIPENKTAYYKIKYQEIDKELITDIWEVCLIETQQFETEL